jgi:hypothetical protein
MAPTSGRGFLVSGQWPKLSSILSRFKFRSKPRNLKRRIARQKGGFAWLGQIHFIPRPNAFQPEIISEINFRPSKEVRPETKRE